MRIRFKRETLGIYGQMHKAGKELDYAPFQHEWQGMTEQERLAKGIHVICWAQGEFDVFGPDDVEVIKTA